MGRGAGLRAVARRARRVGQRWHVRSLGRMAPVDRSFGRARGLPVDRWYGERFLAAHQERIRGAVLEIGDDRYTRMFGDASVTSSDVLHAVPGNPIATMVGDLSTGEGLPSEPSWDCILLYDVLPFIFDIPGAVRTAERLLRPGGTLLATANGIAQLAHPDYEVWGEWWRPTDLALRRVFEDVFGTGRVTVGTHGNVLAACARQYGLAAEEVGDERLAHHDHDYQVTITVVASKPLAGVRGEG